MTEMTRLHVMKEVESCQTNTESSRDEKEDAKAQERKRAAISTVINILESKHDRSLTSSKTECLQDIGGHTTNHPGSVMAVIKQEVTGSEEKSEDFVKDQIPLDKKTNMECLLYEKEVAEYQERKGATVLTAPNLSDFRNSEIECFEDGSSYSPPPKLVSSKRSNQKNPKNDAAEGTGQNIKASENENSEKLEILRSKLASFYSNVMVVDNVSAAKKVVWMLTNKYKHLVHACDTEVAKIDVKQETPVDHGEVICFSIYSGPETDFGNGKSCIWVDLLDGGGRDLLNGFAPFFEDPSIKKIGVLLSLLCSDRFKIYGDCLHCAFSQVLLLFSNLSQGSHCCLLGYKFTSTAMLCSPTRVVQFIDLMKPKTPISPLDSYLSLGFIETHRGWLQSEALTGDRKVMSEDKKAYQKDMSKDNTDEGFMGKVSMKDIFGRRKLKKDGSAGKISTIAPVEELQREERELWISYSAFDSINTLKLFKMETEGMLVDREYLSEIEKVARAEQEAAVNRFRKWASKHCRDAK
ncbi:DNA polymerase I B [Citrus sinensis]|uniref:DNA polymerase I B n=1 Tax=Citrus sinensis TaxID=2711 RepID=A0ACB8P058_CITSI|nr:DNA polymerase I B [Citrus sinensis]